MADGGILMYDCNGEMISNPKILKEIRSRRFGVLVAITPGIQSTERAKDTRKQIKRGKSLLEKSVGDSAEIYAGLALSKTNQREIRDLDFIIKVPNYASDFESYVLGLFDGVLRNDHSFMLGTTMRDTQIRSDKYCHTDLIISADYSDFINALQEIRKMFHYYDGTSSRKIFNQKTKITSRRIKLSCSHDRSYQL